MAVKCVKGLQWILPCDRVESLIWQKHPELSYQNVQRRILLRDEVAGNTTKTYTNLCICYNDATQFPTCAIQYVATLQRSHSPHWFAKEFHHRTKVQNCQDDFDSWINPWSAKKRPALVWVRDRITRIDPLLSFLRLNWIIILLLAPLLARISPVPMVPNKPKREHNCA